MSEGKETIIKDKVIGNKTYHFYRSVYTRDAVAIKERWMRKRGLEFKIYQDGGRFDIYTYPAV